MPIEGIKKKDLAMQNRCISCGIEIPGTIVYTISTKSGLTCECGHTFEPMSTKEYGQALKDFYLNKK